MTQIIALVDTDILRDDRTNEVLTNPQWEKMALTNSSGEDLYQITLTEVSGALRTFIDDGSLKDYTVLDGKAPYFKGNDEFDVTNEDYANLRLGYFIQSGGIWDLFHSSDNSEPATNDDYILQEYTAGYDPTTDKRYYVVTVEGSKLGNRYSYRGTADSFAGISLAPSRKPARSYASFARTKYGL